VLQSRRTHGTLARIPARPDGSAGPAAKIETSQPLTSSGGMRSAGRHTLLLAEGANRADEATTSGYKAEVTVLKDELDGPTAVTRVGNTLFILQAKLKYRNDPKCKGQDPGLIHARAVPSIGNDSAGAHDARYCLMCFSNICPRTTAP
jgi:hypothetical protein